MGKRRQRTRREAAAIAAAVTAAAVVQHYTDQTRPGEEERPLPSPEVSYEIPVSRDLAMFCPTCRKMVEDVDDTRFRPRSVALLDPDSPCRRCGAPNGDEIQKFIAGVARKPAAQPKVAKKPTAQKPQLRTSHQQLRVKARPK